MHRRTLMADAQPDRARNGDPLRPGVHERACEDVDLRLTRTGIGRRASRVGHKSPWVHGWPGRATGRGRSLAVAVSSRHLPPHRRQIAPRPRHVHYTSPCCGSHVAPGRGRARSRFRCVSSLPVTDRCHNAGAMVSARTGGRPGLPSKREGRADGRCGRCVARCCAVACSLATPTMTIASKTAPATMTQATPSPRRRRRGTPLSVGAIFGEGHE